MMVCHTRLLHKDETVHNSQDEITTITSAVGVQQSDRYEVHCEPQIDTVLRIINMFAKRDIHPNDIVITKRQDCYHVTITIHELDRHTPAIITENIKALVMVRSVRRI